MVLLAGCLQAGWGPGAAPSQGLAKGWRVQEHHLGPFDKPVWIKDYADYARS